LVETPHMEPLLEEVHQSKTEQHTHTSGYGTCHHQISQEHTHISNPPETHQPAQDLS